MCPACLLGFCSGGKSETESSELSDACLTLQDAKTTAFRPVMKRWGRWAHSGCTHACTHIHTIFSYYPCEDLPFTDIIINTANKCHVYTYITLTLTSITKKNSLLALFSTHGNQPNVPTSLKRPMSPILVGTCLTKRLSTKLYTYFGIYKLLNPIMCDYKIYLLTPSQQTHCDW